MKWTHRFIQAIRPRVDLGLLDTVLIALAVHRLGHPGNEASGVPGPAPAPRTGPHASSTHLLRRSGGTDRPSSASYSYAES